MTAIVISLPFRQQFRAHDHAAANDRATRADLRRARIRIAQLEASLAEALRDNVLHYDRAREAELRLSELLAERETAEQA